MHTYIEDPKKGNEAANVLGSFDFKILPTGFPGTDGHCLEDTQEAGGSNGHTPANSLNV